MSKTTKAGRRAAFRRHCGRGRPFPFAKVRHLVAKGQEDRALDVVFERLNDMLRDGHFAQVDDVLRRVVLSGLTPSVALGYVTMAWPAQQRLPHFAPLVERMHAWMVGEIGEVRATKLLGRWR